MKVYGVEVTDDQLSCGVSAMASSFKTMDVISALSRAGVIWMLERRKAWQPSALIAYEATNRLLQKERKAGRIKHLGGGKWERIA